MANRATVPKFGAWDKDNVGFTVYFDKVRENKGATAPPLHRPFNPNDPDEKPLVAVAAPSSRPSTSSGHREQERQNAHQHRRSSSVVTDPGGYGAEQSKFAPPPQYHQRSSHGHGDGHGHGHGHSQPPAVHDAGAGAHAHGHAHGHGHHHAAHGGGHGGGRRSSHASKHQQPGPRARSASPQNNATNRNRPAVPKFGAWDDHAGGDQGFTVQFDIVKRKREEARAGTPRIPRPPSPPERITDGRRNARDASFMSKMFGCMLPSARD